MAPEVDCVAESVCWGVVTPSASEEVYTLRT